MNNGRFVWYDLSTTDLDAATERIEGHGGQVAHGPMEIPGGSRIAIGIDPQGAMFALKE